MEGHHRILVGRLLALRRISDTAPLFLAGDSAAVLSVLPSDSIDCAMTLLPYWGKCVYAEEGIGLEGDGNARYSYHVAIYVGGGQVIEAPRTGSVVSYDGVDDAWVGGRF